nr:immunoglobulin heavy chain junction region [Mus musculus]MBK4188720.1 immunoglobulin heavy chain junction region [Mus musculus]MBK4188721.1 immunoglobulin heavy chain junction region [Mus musculus]MBK4188723.1 immunoglobulin heavy chain junction region [Mus musculus]
CARIDDYVPFDYW